LITILDEYPGPRRDFANAVFERANGHLGNPDSAEQAIYNFVKQEKTGHPLTLDAIEAVLVEWEQELPEPSVEKRPPRPQPAKSQEPKSEHEAVIAVRRTLAELLGPAREELAKLDQEISERELELTELRKARTELRMIVGRLDPTAPMRGRAVKHRKASKNHGASASSAEMVLEWARRNTSGQPFSVPEMDESDEMILSQTVLNKAVNRLQEEGRIRLSHVSEKNRRYYLLVG
jgi:hypothetical protein